jgi:hypothetical protein
MVQMLLGRSRYTVGELAEACEVPSHMASEHLRLMQRCGFLNCEKEGRFAYLHDRRTALGRHHELRGRPVRRQELVTRTRFFIENISPYRDISIFVVGEVSYGYRHFAAGTESALLQTGRTAIDLIDVRTPAEFRELHVTGARNVPLDRLDPQTLRSETNGRCSGKTAVRDLSKGRPRQTSLRKARGRRLVERRQRRRGNAGLRSRRAWPLVRGKKTISLERQVRIAAGSLVFIGSVLALAVHPYFVGGLVGLRRRRIGLRRHHRHLRHGDAA